MDAAAELGRNPVSKHQNQPEYGDEQTDAGRDCRTRLARPNSQARTGTGEYYFPCSADHERDWQPYPVDPYSDICDDHTFHTYIHTINTIGAVLPLQPTYDPTKMLTRSLDVFIFFLLKTYSTTHVQRQRQSAVRNAAAVSVVY